MKADTEMHCLRNEALTKALRLIVGDISILVLSVSKLVFGYGFTCLNYINE